MLTSFCLRLALGLVAALLVLSPVEINPRFYRVQFLTALALCAVAAFLLIGHGPSSTVGCWLALASSLVLSFAGSVVWSLDRAPAGRTLVVLTSLSLSATLGMVTYAGPGWDWSTADTFASAVFLGSATSAMLMGHSYLTAPGMSMRPLFRLLSLFFLALSARCVICGVSLWFWMQGRAWSLGEDALLLLPLRWGLGLILPLVLGILAWQTAKIRSTQSATGILYVVVIFSFVGELQGQVLGRMTGSIL